VPTKKPKIRPLKGGRLIWRSQVRILNGPPEAKISPSNPASDLVEFLERMKSKLVFFDCDGVLVFGKPWPRLHQVVGIPKKLEEKWFWGYYSGKLSFKQWVKNVEDVYIKKGLTRALFKKTLKQYTINPEAPPLIKYLKRKKIKTAVVSSGIDYYVKPVAEKLGLDFWRANYTFTFNKNEKFVRFNYLAPDEKAKVVQIKEICQKLKVRPTKTIFVGDSVNDLEAFKFTKHGVLYRTEVDGYKKAAWKTIKNLSEIKNLLER